MTSARLTWALAQSKARAIKHRKTEHGKRAAIRRWVEAVKAAMKGSRQG